jgi:hypothetical protein
MEFLIWRKERIPEFQGGKRSLERQFGVPRALSLEDAKVGWTPLLEDRKEEWGPEFGECNRGMDSLG